MWGNRRYLIDGPHGERIAPEESEEDMHLKNILREEIQREGLHEIEIKELEALIRSEEERLDPRHLDEEGYRRLYHRVELLKELLHELKKEDGLGKRVRKFVASLINR